MIPRSFYFLRHGETDWNRQGLLQGRTDTALNAAGEAQAENIIPVLSKLSVGLLVVSPLIRARRTAEIINASWQKPLIIDLRLQERNFGVFEGMTDSEMDAWKKTASLDKSLMIEENGYPLPDKAEPYETFKRRSVTAIAEHLDANTGKNIMFVAHGGVYRVLRRLLCGDAHQSPNVQPWLFEKAGASWRPLSCGMADMHG